MITLSMVKAEIYARPFKELALDTDICDQPCIDICSLGGVLVTD